MKTPLFGLNRWDRSSPQSFTADVQRAEQLGWDYALLAVSPLSGWNAYQLLSYAARDTSTIKLGSFIDNPVLNHPASTAEAVATLDVISNGRALLGYGIGDSAVFTLAKRPAKVLELEQATTMIKKLLAGRALEIGADRPAQMRNPRPVPVWVTAGGPKALHAAGRSADGVFIRAGRHPEILRHAVEQVHAGAREVGRDPTDIKIGLVFHTLCTDDPKLVDFTAKTLAAGFYEYSPMLWDLADFTWSGPPIDELTTQLGRDFLHATDFATTGPALSFIDSEQASWFCLSGSADGIANQILQASDLGFAVDVVVTHPVPGSFGPWAPVDRALADDNADFMTWFATEVIPRVTAT